jgi:hypothetical protein
MNRLLMIKTATFTLITAFSLTIIFHLLVVVQVIPYTIVWGGRLENPSQMYVFEMVSLSLNAVFLGGILVKVGILKANVSKRLIHSLLWVMLVVFLLNTVGNLFSTSFLETLIFTPITLLLTFCSLVLILYLK